MAVLVTRFKRWLDAAAPGSEYTYHYGELGKDRYDDGAGLIPNEIDVLATEVFSAYERGLVNLYQIPLENSALRGSQYLARRARPQVEQLDAFRARMKAVEYAQAVPVTPKYEDQCEIILPKEFQR